ELVGLLVEAGAGTAGIDELCGSAACCGRIVAEQQRADAVHAGVSSGGKRKAADDEFLFVKAFALDPVGGAAGAVGGVGALGDDAFGVHAAGVAQNGRAIAAKVVGEMEGIGVGVSDEIRKESFACRERERARVAAIEVQEIEDEVGEMVLRAFLKAGLQVSEAGGA